MEFESLIVDAERQYERHEHNKRRIKEVQEGCDSTLSLYDVPTVFRYDQEASNERLVQRVEEIKLLLRNQDMSESEILETVTLLAHKELVRDHRLVTKAAMLAATYHYASPEFDEAAATERKKQFMAELHVFEGFGAEHPWIKFTEGFVPGGALDFNSPDDVHYLVKAEDKAHEAEMATIRLEELAQNIASQHSHLSYEESATLIMTLLPIAGAKNSPDISAKIDEIARQYNVERISLENILSSLITND